MLKTVRPWRPQDRDAVLALNAELQEHERARRPSRRLGLAMTEAYIAALEAELARKADDGALFVAEACGGGVLGFVICFVVEDELEQDARHLPIEDLVVAAAARRRGIGRALVAAACWFARQRAVRRIVLSALTVKAGAEATYAALGFRPALVTLERWLGPEDPVAR